jgi:hypothetical protein
MVSVAHCRQVLGPGCTLSHVELERVRDDLYALARIAIEELRKSAALDAKVQVSDVLGSLPEAERVDVIERAATIEFDGVRTRDEAERLAVAGLVARADAGQLHPSRNGHRREGRRS